MVRQESLHCIKADKPYTSILQAKHGCRHTTSSYMLTHKHTVCFFSMKPSQVRSQFSIQRSETKRFVNTRRRETFRHKTNSMKTMKADDVCVYVWLRERGWSKWQTASVEMSRKVLVRCEAVWFADIRRKCKKNVRLCTCLVQFSRIHRQDPDTGTHQLISMSWHLLFMTLSGSWFATWCTVDTFFWVGLLHIKLYWDSLACTSFPPVCGCCYVFPQTVAG